MTDLTKLRIIIGNPAAEVVANDSNIEFRTPGNGLAVEVEFDARKSPVSIRATRGIASADELYWYQSGSLISFSDNFHDIAACVSPGDRSVPPDAVVDHFLFRTVPGERTYLSGVERLGTGCSLTWTSGKPGLSIHAPEPIIAEPSTDYLKDIEQFFDAEISAIKNAPGTTVNMFSGGVDSTLIQSFLGPDVESVSAAIDTPEFAPEIEYALAASRLLGSTHHFKSIYESEWRQDIEAITCARGLPPGDLQAVLVHRTLDWPAQRFISGQCADALYGLRLFNGKSHSPLYWKLKGYGKAIGIAVSNALARHRTISATRYWSKPTHPYGLAARYASFTNLGLIADVFGAEAVTRALSRRVDYVIQRIGHQIPNGIEGHHHLGHWIDFFCEDITSIQKQAGFSRGKEVTSPFRTFAAVRTAMSIPAGERYVSKGRLKYLLKDLLHKRVPEYDVDKPKKGGGLPLLRFIEAGMLDLDDRYLVPDYLAPVQRVIAQLGKANCIETTWNFFSFMLWHKYVVANVALAPHSSSRVFEYDISRQDQATGMS